MKREEVREGRRASLQAELCRLQDWVVREGVRVIVVFEGRDAAGKGGTIKAITERVSPKQGVPRRRAARPRRTARNRNFMCKRYLDSTSRRPARSSSSTAAGTTGKAGVEHVMGFCSKEQYQQFLEICPMFESHIVKSGILLLKFWLEVGQNEQERRFRARIEDPLRQWKLSPMDLKSYERWYAYSRARDSMLDATDTEETP